MCFVLCLQTIATTLRRDANGLGFSIAGGKGSTPYKGDDEVGFPVVKNLTLNPVAENALVES